MVIVHIVMLVYPRVNIAIISPWNRHSIVDWILFTTAWVWLVISQFCSIVSRKNLSLIAYIPHILYPTYIPNFCWSSDVKISIFFALEALEMAQGLVFGLSLGHPMGRRRRQGLVSRWGQRLGEALFFVLRKERVVISYTWFLKFNLMCWFTIFILYVFHEFHGYFRTAGLWFIQRSGEGVINGHKVFCFIPIVLVSDQPTCSMCIQVWNLLSKVGWTIILWYHRSLVGFSYVNHCVYHLYHLCLWASFNSYVQS